MFCKLRPSTGRTIDFWSECTKAQKARQRRPAKSAHSVQAVTSNSHRGTVTPCIRPNATLINEKSLSFDPIDLAVEEIAKGKFVVVLDDANRENEGDLVAAAELVTTESIAFMVEHTSGVICVGMVGEDLDRLEIPLMVPPEQNSDAKGTAFTVTVDLLDGTSTGISASDRAKTIRALADPTAKARDFRRPGHVFPLRYREGGVLRRRGHTEACVDLTTLAGCRPAGVISEIVNREDGSMARTPLLFEFAKEHNLAIVTIDALVNFLRIQTRL